MSSGELEWWWKSCNLFVYDIVYSTEKDVYLPTRRAVGLANMIPIRATDESKYRR